MSYENVALPEELAKRLKQGFMLRTMPRTLGDLANTDFEPDSNCSASYLISEIPTRHQVRFGNELLYTHCIVDTFALPVLRGEAADICSVDPISGQEFSFQVTPQGLVEEDGALQQAVVSIGATQGSPGSGHTTCCPFINLFVSLEQYEEWIRQHPEVVAVMLPLKDAVSMAQAWLSDSCRLTNNCC